VLRPPVSSAPTQSAGAAGFSASFL